MSDAANPAGGEKVLVSACLLGRSCTYEGKHNGDGACCDGSHAKL